jgi:HEAT repeat protein
VIGRTSGETRHQVLRGFFHASNYLKIDVAKTKAADLMIDALETALLDDLADVRSAVIWPLAWMRHERTPGILRRAYNLEQESAVKAQIVRVTTSLMTSDTGSAGSGVAEDILQQALKSTDTLVKKAADEVMKNRAKVSAVPAGV